MSDLDLLRRLGDQIAPPSFDALRETARTRTRWAVTFTSAVAAAAVMTVLAGVQAAVNDDRSAPGPVKDPADTSRPLTYAEGPTLHFGADTVTMLSKIVEIDMVDGGAVARTDDGGIWLTDGSAPTQIGTLGTPAARFKPDLPYYYGDGVGFMVSNNIGSLVGWFEFPQPSRPELVVYDTASGDEMFRQPIDVRAGSGAVLTAIDERYAYFDVDPVPFEDPASEGRVDLSTGDQIKVTTAAEGAQPAPLGTPRTVLVSREGGGGPYEVDEGIHMQLGWVRGTAHIEPRSEASVEVLDGATRTPFSFTAPPGYPNPDPIPGWLTQWIDDDTIVISYHDYRGQELSDLLVCRISTGACDVAAQSVDAVLPEVG